MGESICPSTSGICAVPNQCLRTAENSYTYDDPDLPPEAHLQSQFISGMLWDLIQTDGLDRDTVASIVIGAVDLFVSNSGFSHLVLAMLMVDEADHGGSYCQTIYDRALARGLQSKISSFDCSQIASLIEAAGGGIEDIEDTTNETTTTRESTSSSKSWCGSIGSGSVQGKMSLVALMVLPLLISIRRWF